MLEIRDRIDRKIGSSSTRRISSTRFSMASARSPGTITRRRCSFAKTAATPWKSPPSRSPGPRPRASRIGQPRAVRATTCRTTLDPGRDLRLRSARRAAGTSGTADRSRFSRSGSTSAAAAPAARAGAVDALRAARRTRRRVRRPQGGGRRRRAADPLRRRSWSNASARRRPRPSTSLQRTESLEARMLTAERRHAMAELARGVSHDVNNALGSMLPLIQQMLGDLRERRSTRRVPRADLEQVQKSLQVCRRIFGGMLVVRARRRARRASNGHVRAGGRDDAGDSQERHRAARHPAVDRSPGRRPAAGGLRAVRSRAGAAQPAHQRPRRDRSRRDRHGPRPPVAGRRATRRSRTPARASRPSTCRGCSSRSSRPRPAATASA